ncbi:uncharacterized protein [Nicotiana sylvestris]|uniref:uncharacterized protein n=1 Tax=Nicotiana sylvestris TaxID=4096 RepID=UPI00388C7B79
MGLLPAQSVAVSQAQVGPIITDDEQMRLERFGRLQPASFSMPESEDAQDIFNWCQQILRMTGILKTSGGDRVIAYALRRLKTHEKNYPIHDLNLDAIVHALNIWRHYIYGVSCEVFTDHRSLQHLCKQKDLTLRQRILLELLKDYDITILYHPGKDNVVVDALSRKVVSMGSLAFILIGDRPLAVDVQALAIQFMRLDVSEPSLVLACVVSRDVTIGDDSVLQMQGRLCVPNVDGWFEPGEARLLGTNLVQDALNKIKLIQDWLHTVQSRQKSYADQKVRDVAYMVGEKVLLKISPMKGVMRFGKNGKLSPRYIGPFEVLQKIGEMAYKLALPPSMSSVLPVFHVSMLRKYVGDPSHVLNFSTVQLDGELTYDMEPVAILGQ